MAQVAGKLRAKGDTTDEGRSTEEEDGCAQRMRIGHKMHHVADQVWLVARLPLNRMVAASPHSFDQGVWQT